MSNNFSSFLSKIEDIIYGIEEEIFIRLEVTDFIDRDDPYYEERFLAHFYHIDELIKDINIIKKHYKL